MVPSLCLFINQKRDNIIFLSYENFCEKPKYYLNKIINNEEILANIDLNIIQNNNLEIAHKSEMKNKAYKVYEELNKL